MGTLLVPKSGNIGDNDTIDDISSLVIVGANGSGKSRLGAWIEDNPPNGVETHRVSAQRALTFADQIQPRALDQAQLLFRFGHIGQTHRRGNRWKNNPTGGLLQDYDHLLALLFARERERDASLTKKCRDDGVVRAADIPDSPVDTLQAIWNHVFPHRNLLVEDHILKAQVPAGNEYAAKEMSDGERVAIYLMGESLCAPQGSIIIIDEPEIHLHKAIQGRLWDEIEAARSDCVFVYITHDLDFAATRSYAKKLWLSDYDGTNWTWNFVPESETFPEPMVLLLLGSRKPVLFVEGDEDSIDSKVYRAVYPDHTIAPRGGCHAVIQATRALRKSPEFHHLTAYGLIDRDYRNDEELLALQKDGVYSCNVAEVENILCLPEVLEVAAESTKGDIEEAKQVVLEAFAKQVDHQVYEFAHKEVHFKLGRFDKDKSGSKQDLVDRVNDFVDELDVERTYDRQDARLKKLLQEKNYEGVLKAFNRKSLSKDVARKLGFTPDGFQKWFFTTLEEERTIEPEHQDDEDPKVTSQKQKCNKRTRKLILAIAKHLPNIPAD